MKITHGILLALCLLALSAGCRDKDKPSSGLPNNPAVPADKPGSISESWSWQPKDYDNSYRIRWPSFFAASCGGASYTKANGLVAAFRSYDTDNGAMRPSYTMAKVPIPGPITCVLYDNAGKAVAWFSVPDTTAIRHGKLP